MYAQKGATFSIAAAPRELLDKRTQRANDAEKGTPKKRERKDGPRNVNQDALAKKGKEQIDALETLGTFLVDLVNVGVGGITPKMRDEIAQQAKRMTDTNIVQASVALKRLAAALGNNSDDDDDDDDDDDESDSNGTGLNLSKETEARVAWMITLLHAMVRRGTKLLDGRLATEGVSAADLDATYDLILSKRWQLRDLKHAGHWVTNRTLLRIGARTSR